MIRLRSASARHVVESKQRSLSPGVAELRLFKPAFVRAVGNKFLCAVLLCWLLCLQPVAAEEQDASELAGLMDTLKLERVHLVSYSYGAFASLFFALQHPERVRSLTLSEPPILKWLPEIPGGQEQLDHFMGVFWKPVADAFRDARPEEALRI